jgi:acyl carrier protein
VEGTQLRQRVVDSIRTVLPRVLRDEPAPALSEGTRLMEDLGLSSSSTMELLLELEDDLDIQIDVADVDRGDFTSVGTLADFIAGHTLPAG